MEFQGSAMDSSIFINMKTEDRQVHHGHQHHDDHDDSKHKSKNLYAERRRREKLNERLLKLRSLVPIITNMKKEAIVTDAITYIEQLQDDVKRLSDQLLEMEPTTPEEKKPTSNEIGINTREEMDNHGVKEDFEVMKIDENKLWMKIVIEKKRGWFTKLMETMSFSGFELIDVNVTYSKGAMLVSSCVVGSYERTLDVQQTKESLLQIIGSI